MQAGKRLSLLALLAIAAPVFAQAALPEAIQAALARADLSASDMSIVITPVGDKNASHLPSPIQVVDSVSATSTIDPTTDSKADSPKSTQNPIKEGKKNLQNSTEYHSALTTIEKRTIKKYEQEIHAYTDDPIFTKVLRVFLPHYPIAIPLIIISQTAIKQLPMMTVMIQKIIGIKQRHRLSTSRFLLY